MRKGRAQQRAMALQVARELLPVMGVVPEMVHADRAFEVFDRLVEAQPQSLVAQWWKTASERQVDLFIDEWEDWRVSVLALCPVCRYEKECREYTLCHACHALFEGAS